MKRPLKGLCSVLIGSLLLLYRMDAKKYLTNEKIKKNKQRKQKANIKQTIKTKARTKFKKEEKQTHHKQKRKS